MKMVGIINIFLRMTRKCFLPVQLKDISENQLKSANAFGIFRITTMWKKPTNKQANEERKKKERLRQNKKDR